MHQSLARFSEPGSSVHEPSLAVLHTTTPVLKLSVHTALVNVRAGKMPESGRINIGFREIFRVARFRLLQQHLPTGSRWRRTPALQPCSPSRDMLAGNSRSEARSSRLSCRARNSSGSPMVEKGARKHSPKRSIPTKIRQSGSLLRHNFSSVSFLVTSSTEPIGLASYCTGSPGGV